MKVITLDDSEEIGKYTYYNKSGICDNTLTQILMWRDYFKSRYTIIENHLLWADYVPEKEIWVFHLPLGNNPYELIKKLPITCYGYLTEAEYNKIGNIKSIELIKDMGDYIYLKSDLKELVGKRYRHIRNHINSFESNIDNWRILDLNLDRAQEFIGRVHSKGYSTAHEELDKSKEVISHISKYKLQGKMLEVNGQIEGITLYEEINNVAYIHIEKANSEINGAYQVLFINTLNEVKSTYINREEDLGIPGLRQSKLGYRPIEIKDKFIITKDVE